jgi:hypothetical protein
MPRLESTTGLPETLQDTDPLWETVVGPDRRGDLTAMRLYPDGRLYHYSAKRRIRAENGLPKRVPADPRWRLDARVGEDGLQAVREALAELWGTSLAEPEGVHQGEVLRTYRAADGDRSWHDQVMGEPPPRVTAVDHALQRGIVPGSVPIQQEQ